MPFSDRVVLEAESLTPAAAASRRAIAASRSLTRVVEFLSTGGVERLTRQAHHRIREMCASVLRHSRASDHRRRENDDRYETRHVHSSAPSPSPI